MSHGELLHGSWSEFINLLGIKFTGLHNSLGVRPHHNPDTTPKDKLQPFYVRKCVLIPFLDIMHRVFRNTLFPRVGNKYEVHYYLVDMPLMCQEGLEKSNGPLDVANVMFYELQMVIYNRKVPIYGPTCTTTSRPSGLRPSLP